jgi:NAD(P)-dependent dehydrogenase (short-subunit alcohol dehydrogenase family)
VSVRTLIVTGGTGGLGTEVVGRLLPHYRCVVLYHSDKGFQALKAVASPSDHLEGLQGDLGQESSVRAAIQQTAGKWGPPYGLVHLAGSYDGGSVAETTREIWDALIGLNLTSSFTVIKEALAVMHRDAPGRIIAISSQASIQPMVNAAAYSISKSGLNMLIQLTAKSLKGSGITVNALLPDTLDTPAMREAAPDAPRVPLERVAETIAFLLSDDAASITAALIPLTGTISK